MRSDRAKGFSLVELTVVLVVLGAVVAIAAPRFNDADANKRIELARERIERDLVLADKDAWHTGRFRQVVFDTVANTYEIVGMTDEYGNPYKVDLSASPYRVSIGTVDFDGSTSVTLDGRSTDVLSGTISLEADSVAVSTAVKSSEVTTLAMDVSATKSAGQPASVAEEKDADQAVAASPVLGGK